MGRGARAAVSRKPTTPSSCACMVRPSPGQPSRRGARVRVQSVRAGFALLKHAGCTAQITPSQTFVPWSVRSSCRPPCMTNTGSFPDARSPWPGKLTVQYAFQRCVCAVSSCQARVASVWTPYDGFGPPVVMLFHLPCSIQAAVECIS